MKWNDDDESKDEMINESTNIQWLNFLWKVRCKSKNDQRKRCEHEHISSKICTSLFKRWTKVFKKSLYWNLIFSFDWGIAFSYADLDSKSINIVWLDLLYVEFFFVASHSSISFVLEILSILSDWQILFVSCASCVSYASHASFTSFAWSIWFACIISISSFIALTRCQGTRQSCDTNLKRESHLIKNSWYSNAKWLCIMMIDFNNELCWLTVALKKGWKDLWQLMNRSSIESSTR